MDFTPTPESIEAAELAGTVFAGESGPERLREIDALADRFDPKLWQALGKAGLLGLCLPEEYDGAGLGLLELVAVLEQQGRVVGAVPLAPHVVAAMTIAAWGSEEQCARWLPRAASGETLLTVAVGDIPSLGATRADAVVRVGATVELVTTPEVEARVLSTGESAGVVSGGRAEPLGDAETTGWVRDRLTVAQAALQLGVVEGALELTASYAREREQFGRPIGTFQAVSQRLANGFIDVLGLRLTLTHAAWRLAEGLPAQAEVATAALWAADAGHALAHTAVHVHGGVGIDLDGETHRYFTAAKQGELLLGGTTAAARSVGAILAAG